MRDAGKVVVAADEYFSFVSSDLVRSCDPG